jgi:hypothetical protein
MAPSSSTSSPAAPVQFYDLERLWRDAERVVQYNMRLHFVWIGKTKDRRCAGLIEDYLERIGRFVSVELARSVSCANPAG